MNFSSPHGCDAVKLHPKEHGAYAILGIPIATALITGGPTVPGVGVAIAAVAGFLAHEPLLVAWGHRGRRAQRSTPAAKSRWIALLAIASLAGCTAWVAGSPSERLAIVFCLALAASSFAVAFAGKHRTLAGQLWGVIGLTFPCVPILLSGGTSAATSINIWAVWLIVFGATTLAVRSVIAAQKDQSRLLHTLILTVITLPVAAGMALGVNWIVVAMPMIALSWFLLIVPPAAKHLKRVGWASLAATLLTAVLMIGTFVESPVH